MLNANKLNVVAALIALVNQSYVPFRANLRYYTECQGAFCGKVLLVKHLLKGKLNYVEFQYVECRGASLSTGQSVICLSQRAFSYFACCFSDSNGATYSTG
jgi:hypothetical protein